MTRRDFLRLSAGTAALATAFPGMADSPAQARIPSTGEPLARVGLGTWRTFDVGADAGRRARLADVLRALVAGGGSVVDTSPMYGTSPAVLGDLVAETGLRDRLFLATKVWISGDARGREQMDEQFRLLRTERVELMQVHNLVDWTTQLATLRRWKEEGRIRHVGITHYQRGALPDVLRVVRAERLDFVQYPLSLEEPAAAGELVKLCAERGAAFIANRPFGEGGALSRVRGIPLPPWAAELGIRSWAQFLLKWILAHPEVTCTIPGTGNPAHMTENLAAAHGAPLDPAGRDRLAAHWRGL
ncbi:MAG TPA: aldo/keto reductase [Opitutaceae bacterium]|nr:aldo/keto reductase [Opitutaceae bacterium]